jgi:16S rRNA (guanine(966)-N(2))-methyltransferase RsmD
MRIITGKYKGRHFDIPKTFKARPTTDFAKENIFNVLTQYIDFEGTMALDLFSGTGSITLELMSRGCEHVISVELDRDHHRFIQQCVQKITSQGALVRCLRGDVFRFVKSCKQQFDFIFADPPYVLKELPTIPSLIFEKDLLKDDGIFVFEHGKEHDFSDDPHFVEHRSYGSVNFSIFRKAGRAFA